MAIKGQKTAAAENAETAEAAPSGAETATTADAPKVGRKRGPRGPVVSVWNRERDQALAAILRSPNGTGAIKTASSVASALAQDPAFTGIMITPAQVAAKVKNVDKSFRAKGATPPVWLKLDKARRTADISAFLEGE